MKPASTDPAETLAPAACPFCRSTKIAAPSERVTASTYWRCEACGQLWNVARDLASQRVSRWNRRY